MRIQAGLQVDLAILKERYHLTDQELIELISRPSIPAEAFATKLTPLETASTYLSKDYTEAEIAKLLARPQATIRHALQNAKKKRVKLPKQESNLRIPATIFTDTRLTASEAIVHHLSASYHLPNAAIAHTIGRDQRNTHQLAASARRKVGGAQ